MIPACPPGGRVPPDEFAGGGRDAVGAAPGFSVASGPVTDLDPPVSVASPARAEPGADERPGIADRVPLPDAERRLNAGSDHRRSADRRSGSRGDDARDDRRDRCHGIDRRRAGWGRPARRRNRGRRSTGRRPASRLRGRRPSGLGVGIAGRDDRPSVSPSGLRDGTVVGGTGVGTTPGDGVPTVRVPGGVVTGYRSPLRVWTPMLGSGVITMPVLPVAVPFTVRVARSTPVRPTGNLLRQVHGLEDGLAGRNGRCGLQPCPVGKRDGSDRGDRRIAEAHGDPVAGDPAGSRIEDDRYGCGLSHGAIWKDPVATFAAATPGTSAQRQMMTRAAPRATPGRL